MSGGPLPGLEGLRVLDLSDDVAGAYCAKLLSDAGASVTRVEQPEGHSLRRWSVNGDVGIDGDADGALFRFLASSQESLVLDLAPSQERTGRWRRSRLFGRGHRLDLRRTRRHDRPCDRPCRIPELHPSLVVVVSRRSASRVHAPSEQSSEFLIQALSGSLHNHGSAEGLPLAVGGALAEWTLGIYGALGAVSALSARRRSGRGDLVDISALEALTMTFICYPSVAAKMPGGERRRSTYTMTPSIEPCRDGYRRHGDDHHGAMDDLPRNDRAARPGRRRVPAGPGQSPATRCTQGNHRLDGPAYGGRSRPDRVDVPHSDGAAR